MYNALEQLTSRTSTAAGAPIGAVQYIYDLDGHLIAEATGSTGANLRDYIWLPSNDNNNDTYTEDVLAANDNAAIDLPLAVAESATVYHIHTDHLGRPIRMTDAAKTTVWQATWKPWGEVQSISGTTTNNLRFPGQTFQIETGLHYNWHRNYDPVTGRYTQPDPLGFIDGPSIYAYAGNSPFMNVDREGLQVVIPVPRPKPNVWFPVPGGRKRGLNDPIPTRPWTPWDDQIKSFWDMCRRAFGGGRGGGGDECETQFSEERGRCNKRKWQMAHPDYFRGCMDRAMTRFQNCKKGHTDGPPEWGDRDEETGLNHGR